MVFTCGLERTNQQDLFKTKSLVNQDMYNKKALNTRELWHWSHLIVYLNEPVLFWPSYSSSFSSSVST